MDTLTEELDRLYAERRKLDEQINDVVRQIQAKCTHVWKLCQVAGDGKFCLICGKHDYSED